MTMKTFIMAAVVVVVAAIGGVTAAGYIHQENPHGVNRAAKADRLEQQSSINFEDRWSAVKEFAASPALKQWAIEHGLMKPEPTPETPPVVAKGK